MKNIKTEHKYHSNGKLKEKYEYYLNENNEEIKHGFYKRCQENGNTEVDRTYVNGLIEGEQTVYYDTGDVYIKCFFVNGKRDGKDTMYWRTGNVCSITIYQNEEVISYQSYGDGEYEELYEKEKLEKRQKLEDKINNTEIFEDYYYGL